MNIEAIHSKPNSIHYKAHQLWEQEGPKALLMEIVNGCHVIKQHTTEYQ